MNMADTPLYIDASGGIVTQQTVLQALRDVGADDCDVLFVHTDIVFGRLSKGIKRQQLLQALAETLLALNVPTLLLPTFTYSFANNEVFDVRSSKARMGVLIEYMRKLPQVTYRTVDPLLSVAVLGQGKEAFYDLPHNSLGRGGVFDRLHNMHKRVKFLVFGGEFGQSFTLVHHVEKMLEVPYRYDQEFTGTLIDWSGQSREETWSIHTACGGVEPRAFYDLEEDLVRDGYMKRRRLGDSKVVCVSEQDVYAEIVKRIEQDPYYFLERPYTAADLTHEYHFGKNGELVTHC